MKQPLLYRSLSIHRLSATASHWSSTSLLALVLAFFLLVLPAHGQHLANSQENFAALVLPNGTLWTWGRTVGGPAGSRLVTPTQVGPGTTWQCVATGYSAILAVRQDGTLWAWGNNGRGQLGISGLASAAVPVQVGTATTWQSVAAGLQHTVAVRTDGTLWAWGDNQYGQLGTGTSGPTVQATPVQIGTATNWQCVVAADNHTLALRTDGTLWAWGDNTSHELGLSSVSQQASPSPVNPAFTWQSISTGNRHTLAVRADGTLWAWGDNTNGKLGDGTSYARTLPVQIGTAATWRRVAAGYDHSLALRTDGTLWAWGSNASGQLGVNLPVYAWQYEPLQVGAATTWQEVAAGGSSTLARQADNSVWVWGNNSDGQTGIAALAINSQPVFKQLSTPPVWRQITASFIQTSALATDGTLWVWGRQNNTAFQPAPQQLGTAPWQSISSGYEHTVGVRTDGTLWAWGGNSNGQLGIGGNLYKSSPVQVGTATTWRMVAAGYSHTVALRADGTLWSWGSNGLGQVGDGTQLGRSTPVQIGIGSTWQSVAAGYNHTLAIRSDGTLWAWGDNTYGQLGSAMSFSTLPIQVGAATNWQLVVASAKHSLGLRTDGTLWSWGDNTSGQLGSGDFVAQPIPTQLGTAKWLALATNKEHTLAVRADGTLWGWGFNSCYQLGDNVSNQPRPNPAQIGLATNWQRVAAGTIHSVALRTDGSAWACGDNTAGQLGIPDFSTVPLLLFTGSPLATVSATGAARLLPYPNPAHDYLQIPGLPPNARLLLFDAQGRQVRSSIGPRLSVQGLPAGIYFLRGMEPNVLSYAARVLVN